MRIHYRYSRPEDDQSECVIRYLPPIAAPFCLLNAANGTEIGPSIVLPVKQGDKVSLSTEYFYTEDAAGATYDNIHFLINEILIAFAAGGSGILPLNETQLIDLASGQGNYSNALATLFNNEIDTTDMSRPYAYMVWTAYDANMNIIPSASGIERVSDPNDLEVLIRDEIAIVSDGFLHARACLERAVANSAVGVEWVSNGSAVSVSFDNFYVSTMRGKVRQINHYYPYGLTISGIGANSDEYLNKYTTKELQTGEWNPALSNGLEMYDFHARHGACPEQQEQEPCGCRRDPQLGRWFAPDPAEQFSNPYLAMGNNPVMYVDPDGEFVLLALGAAAIAGGYIGASVQQGTADFTQWDNTWGQAAITGAMLGVATVATAGKAGLLGAKMSTGMGALANAKTAKILSKTMAGGLNMMNHHDADEGFGARSLGYFAAGFVGAHYGIKGGMAKGFLYGGGSNIIAGYASGNIEDGYEGLQHFVGGGLSAVAGTNMYKSFGSKWYAADGSWSEYTSLKSDPWSKFAANKLGASTQWEQKFFSYGFQNLAGSFAYDSNKDFFNRTLSQHFGVFWYGGASGASQDWLMGYELRNPSLQVPARVLGSSLLFAGEYAMTYIYQRNPQNGVSWDSYLNYKRSSYMFKTFGFVGF